MIFARKVWHLLVAVKDGLALLFLLLFFCLLYLALTVRQGPSGKQEGALLLKLNGAVVEEPAQADPMALLTGAGLPGGQYRARDIVRALDLAAHDPKIKAVVFDLSGFTGGGLVHMEEIGAAEDRVKAAGKPVFAYAAGYADDAVMVAAHASEAWIHPLGTAFVMGPGGETQYYGPLLQKLKVNAHVFRVGTYKEYVEPYVRDSMSDPAREARKAVLGALFESWKGDVAKARPKANLALVTTDPAGWIKQAGGDGARAALAAGLVDKAGDAQEFGERVAALVGPDGSTKRPGGYAHATLRGYLAANPPKAPGKAIGVVTVAGDIVDGDAGPGTAGGDRIARLIESADTAKLAALVVRVDSPGGSVMAAERIRRAIERRKAAGLPVVVSMANLAASGGYWVSTPATRIFAEPGTVTGSIGIFAMIPSFENTLSQYGVKSDGVRTTPISGQPDVLGGLTPEVEAMLQSTIESGYARFLALVAKSRGKTTAQVDAIAQGRIWDGGTARQLGLVDQFGTLDDALAYAAKAAKLGDGQWHAAYLGEGASPYASLLEKLAGNGDDDPSSGGDAFAMIAARQQASLARALSDATRLLGVHGAQAYCLGCPEPVTAARDPGRSLLGWAGLLGLRFGG